jgi:hypothetical protein
VPVGPREVVLNAQDEIADLKVAAARTTCEGAIGIKPAGDGRPSVGAGIGDLLAPAPASAALDADVAATPVESGRRGRRNLGWQVRGVTRRRKAHQRSQNWQYFLHFTTLPHATLRAQI